MCGGTHSSPSRMSANAGLSPRVRGNQRLHIPPQPINRSIPACAGEPRSTRSAKAHRWVYPRVCGGTPPDEPPAGGFGGLSPRVRGNQQPLPGYDGVPGSIPACAGEPLATPFGCRWRRVYPRVCGGTNNLRFAGNRRDGLSPRVRGNLGSPDLHPSRCGSIPACAGEPHGLLIAYCH